MAAFGCHRFSSTIRQDLLADDRFDSSAARCDLYQRMFKGTLTSAAEDMVSLGCD